MNDYQNDTNNPSKVLYSDKLVEITSDSILFHDYFFPAGNKRIKLADIKCVKVINGGCWRLWGTGDFRTWAPADFDRPKRDKIFLVLLKNKWRRIMFTVEDSAAVIKILKEKGLLEEQERISNEYSPERKNVMKTKTSLIIIAGLIIASFAVSLYYYPHLPERIASHWNAKGQVDGYMSKEAGAFIMPVVMVITVAIFLVILRIDPLKKNIDKFKSYFFGFIIAECLLLFGVHWWMMLWNVGVEISVNRVMPVGIGALYFFIGYIMKNFKRNWFIGIRTPWTLSNEIVWKRTHEISGKLFMGSGVIAMSGMFWPEYSIWLIIVPVLTVAAISIIYSYVVFRQVTGAELDGTADEMQISEGSGDTTWDNIKEGYLCQVEKCLMKVKHPAKKQVLEDVASHLDQKYAELDENSRTWEGYQQVIIEMGPAEDYAELLDGESPAAVTTKGKSWLFYFLIFDFLAVMTVLGVILWQRGTFKGQGRSSASVAEIIGEEFVNDPEAVGVWKSVDFVREIEHFTAGEKHWQGDLYLKELRFFDGGTTGGPWYWTKGKVYHPGNKTMAKYLIKEMRGAKYMFFEWMSGDVTIRGRKPAYYVLKKLDDTGVVAIVLSFESKGNFKHTTAKELLDAFNGELNFRVKTHHFRTEAIGVKLIGHICVDNDRDKNNLLRLLHESEKINIFNIDEISEEEFEEYKRLGQPGLKIQKSIDITIDTFKTKWQELPKGRFKFQTTIVNLGGDICGEFDFVIQGAEYFENIVYTAGPIKSGETWHASTSEFKLSDGLYEFTVELDPANKLKELKENNNRKTNKFKVKDGKPYHVADDQSTEGGVTCAYAWLGLIDGGKYGKSWEEAASFFKLHVTRTQWKEALEGIRTPLGKVISREVISQTPTKSVPGGPDGEYVIIQFRTEFKNKKENVETVTPMLEKDGKWRVSGYYIK